MQPSEWLSIVATIRDWWPHSPVPEDSITQWGNDLSDLDADVVLASVTALYRDGREHAPNGGVIRRKAIDLILDAPSWSVVQRELAACISFPERVVNCENESDIDPVGHDYPRRERLERCHPLIQKFVHRLGWEQAGAVGGNEEARLRTKWQAFVNEAKDEMAYATIEGPASMRALDRARNGQLTRGLGVAEVRQQIAERAGIIVLPEDEVVEAEVVED